MPTECPNCGGSFKQIGNHWQSKPEHRPILSDLQHQIVTGLLMGDGNICIREGLNPYLQANMITPEYLSHVDRIFGVLSTGVRKTKSPTSDEMFTWKTRSLPELEQYANWYSTGAKEYPDEIELAPTVLKHWYCCDGHLSHNRGSQYVTISASNERENTDFLSRLFTKQKLPEPSVSVYNRDNRADDCVIRFSTHDNEHLFRYMGDPLPGFEYKWPEKYK